VIRRTTTIKSVLLIATIASVATIIATIAPADDSLYPVIIESPPTLGTLQTSLSDVNQAQIGVACATCHSESDSSAIANREGAPKDIHESIVLAHGSLSCNACHSSEDRTKLHLADGTRLEMGDVIKLCGQCHGTHLRSFEHMAHGGSRGYWDRTRGPILRNSCVSCHAAHRPAYPLVHPAPPPRDRFLGSHAPETNASKGEPANHD
jgi:hypothetical protein